MIYKIPTTLKEKISIPQDATVVYSVNNLAVMRYEIFNELLSNSNIDYTIVAPNPTTLKFWDSRENEYVALDAALEYAQERLSIVGSALYNEEACLDEWNLSLSTISLLISDSSVIFVDEDYKELIEYKRLMFKDNIIFYSDVTSILQR